MFYGFLATNTRLVCVKTAGAIAAVSGVLSSSTSLGLVAELAQDWQAFWGIVVGVTTVAIFAWATYLNQRRMDAKLREAKRHNAAVENAIAPKDIH